MPNGRNSGRLYPGIPGDCEILHWNKDTHSTGLWWNLEGSFIGPLHAMTEQEVYVYAKEHNLAVKIVSSYE